MARIAIIGAGLTGLSTAYHLEQRGYTDFELFEKESSVGGLCRTIQQDGFTFDFTGHLLHASDPYFQEFIYTITHPQDFNQIHRQSFIYSQERYTRYPYQINLYGLPTKTIADCIHGFVTRNTSLKKPKSFLEWVEKQFGSGFSDYFFKPYQRKIFAYDLRDITASWTGRFVPQTSLEQIIEGALTDKQDSVGYNSNFLYPKKGGIFFWVDKLAQAIAKPIHTGYCVETINTKEKILSFTNGHMQSYDILINTMPLDNLLNCLEEKSDTTLRKAIAYLKCNSVVNFNLGIARSDLSDKHWIYYPENQYPFYRIGFPHNFSRYSAPQGQSSLYGEFAHIGKSSRWVTRTLNQALKHTKQLLGISDHEITTEKILYISHAYVIYNFWREKYLPRIHKQLRAYNIHSVGRYGEWKYSSMQEAILDGKSMAEKITLIPARTKEKKEQTIYEKDITRSHLYNSQQPWHFTKED